MKAKGVSNISIAAAVILVNIIVSVIMFFIVMPLFEPTGLEISGSGFDVLQRNFAILAFVVGCVVTLALVFGALYLARRGGDSRGILDAIRQPCLVLDEHNRYAYLNPEAERVLGLSRERDLGQPADSGLLSALVAGAGDLDARSLIARAGIRYQVLDNPLPVANPAADSRRRVVILRDVDSRLRTRDAFRDIVDAMSALDDNTKTIDDVSHRLAQGAVEQATSLETISSSLDEFAQKIQGNTETAAKGTQLAAQAREAAERSGNEIANALSAMNDVQDAGVRIARIVKLIDDIAFQTNLLALNASVEAARAGRQGKGFAVVAEEVRNLAGRSARAAKDTAGMVEDVTERIGNASMYISKLEEMLRNILQDTVRMADSSAASSSTSAEQATAILQVNQELGQMNSMTKTTKNAAEHTAAAVANLSRQVEDLRRMLENFNLGLGNAPKLQAPDFRPSARAVDAGDHRAINRKNLEFHGGYAAPAASGKDGYGGYSPPHAGMSDDFAAPFRHKAASEWDPGTGGGKATPAQLTQGPTEFRTTQEGDRVVRPGQSIHLDDTEFGRY